MSNRGRPSASQKRLNKAQKINSKCVNISISIPQDLLNKVGQQIKGNSRSEKVVTCIIKGFERLTQ